ETSAVRIGNVASSEREGEGGALVGAVGFAPDIAVVAANDSLDGREANASAGAFLGRMQALERLKQPLCMPPSEARPLIDDLKDAARIIARDRSELDPRLGALRRVLPCIRKQVVHEHAHKAPVRIDRDIPLDTQLDRALRLAVAQALHDLRNHRAEVEAL